LSSRETKLKDDELWELLMFYIRIQRRDIFPYYELRGMLYDTSRWANFLPLRAKIMAALEPFWVGNLFPWKERERKRKREGKRENVVWLGDVKQRVD
jgi:hypothetical protein